VDYYLKNTALPGTYTARGLDLVEEELKYDNMDIDEKRSYHQCLKEFKISESTIETALYKGLAEGLEEGKS
jgi:hypothetical protein